MKISIYIWKWIIYLPQGHNPLDVVDEFCFGLGVWLKIYSSVNFRYVVFMPQQMKSYWITNTHFCFVDTISRPVRIITHPSFSFVLLEMYLNIEYFSFHSNSKFTQHTLTERERKRVNGQCYCMYRNSHDFCYDSWHTCAPTNHVYILHKQLLNSKREAASNEKEEEVVVALMSKNHMGCECELEWEIVDGCKWVLAQFSLTQRWIVWFIKNDSTNFNSKSVYCCIQPVANLYFAKYQHLFLIV